MREFEKQYNLKYPLPPTIERGPIGREHKEACKRFWKGALRWAKAMHDISSEPRFAVNIREELKE